MSGSALRSQGVVFKLGDGASPEVFTALPEIKTISGPSGSAPIINVSDLDSTAVEKIMGLLDNGQVTIGLNYRPAQAMHALLKTNREAATLTNVQLLFTDTPVTTWDFATYITGLAVDIGVDQPIDASITFEVSGAITET